jgi:hypothetical protein
VIAKVEHTRGRSIRVTINTAAVWRDWVRDQASEEPKSKSKAAADGEKSVASNGEPLSPDNLVVLEVPHDVKVETRYRSSTDEVSEGAKTPEKAAAAEAATDPADTSKPDTARKSGAKTPHFKVVDLKPGLFIEVTSHRVKGMEKVSLVRVMRPVGGANIPASVEKPTDKKD